MDFDVRVPADWLVRRWESGAMARTKVLKTTRTEKEVSRQVVEAAAMFGVELKRRNVGAFANPKGQMVRCGDPGDGDYYAVLPDGRHMDCEIKREGFDANKLSGKAREHFDAQLSKLRETNARGGIGFLVTDVAEFITVMRIVLRGGWVDETGYDGLTVYDPHIVEGP